MLSGRAKRWAARRKLSPVQCDSADLNAEEDPCAASPRFPATKRSSAGQLPFPLRTTHSPCLESSGASGDGGPFFSEGDVAPSCEKTVCHAQP